MFLLVPLQSESEEEDQWFKPRKYSGSWRSKLFGLLRLTKRKEGSDEEEEENKGKELLETEWTLSSRTSEAEPEPWESEIEVGILGSHWKGEVGAQKLV